MSDERRHQRAIEISKGMDDFLPRARSIPANPAPTPAEALDAAIRDPSLHCNAEAILLRLADRGFALTSQPAADTPTFRVPYPDEPGGRRHPTYETECEYCGTRLRVTNNYSTMGDFLDQTVQPAADTLDVHINDGGAHDRAMAWSEGYGEGFEAAEALVNMPQGMYEANRYDTDTTHVLHLWPSPDGGESVDLIVPIDAAYRDAKGTPEPTPTAEYGEPT